MIVPSGSLYLFASPLWVDRPTDTLSAYSLRKLAELRWFIVEQPRTTRRFFSQLGIFSNISDLEFDTIRTNTSPELLESYVDRIRRGESTALFSEVGTPVIADPGASLVALAQREEIEVVPMGVPSSPLQALIGSGFSGQKFTFHGYLPIEERACLQYLRKLLRESKESTHLFMETPYRSAKLFLRILQISSQDQLLCVASCLGSSDQLLQTRTTSVWQKRNLSLHKKPCIFVLGQFL